jgi:hypothetical protein
MRLRLITEFRLTREPKPDPISQAKKRDRIQKLYFYDLPELVQQAAFADMSYDDFAEAKVWADAYFLKTKDGREFGYNRDGTRWKPVLESSYEGLEDADTFEDPEDNDWRIIKQAVIYYDGRHDPVAVVDLYHQNDDNEPYRYSEPHDWEPEWFDTFDEVVERCRPHAEHLIKTAVAEMQRTIEWCRSPGHDTDRACIGSRRNPGIWRTPERAIYETEKEIDQIRSGDLALALDVILV